MQYYDPIADKWRRKPRPDLFEWITSPVRFYGENAEFLAENLPQNRPWSKEYVNESLSVFYLSHAYDEIRLLCLAWLIDAKANSIVIGTRFGLWTVKQVSYESIDTTNNRTFRKRLVDVVCDCGTVKKGIVAYTLTSGASKSCGCRPSDERIKIRYIGTIFGSWTVIEDNAATKKSGQRYVLCRCTCGTESEIELASLKNGDSKSCGCYRRVIKAKEIRERKAALRAKVEAENLILGGKVCSICKILKPFALFFKNRSCMNGYNSACKECRLLQDQRNNDKKRGRPARIGVYTRQLKGKLFAPGIKFGKWNVITGEIIPGRSPRVSCRCDCGTLKDIMCHQLISGLTRYCRKCSLDKRKEKYGY